MLIPRMKALPAFIFEFKYTKDVNADLGSLAEKAFRQIEDKKYDTELQDIHVSSIRKIGIAFRGKEARARG